jgi:hypothetical protein
MKKILLLLLTTFTLGCCNKDDEPKPITELEKLPPATQTGANTAGCLVNGVAFLPKGYLVTGNLVCNYIDGKDFILGISERIMQGSSDNIRSIFVVSENQNLHNNVGVTFQLGQDNNNGNSKFGSYIINAVAYPDHNYYSTNTIVTGELKITYHNYNNAIISGTFWFDAINSNGEIVKVREGRFDKHY